MIPISIKKKKNTNIIDSDKKIVQIFIDYLGYLKDNLSTIIKSAIYAILLILGPLFAFLVRLTGANYSSILIISFIFEVIGVTIFWVMIKPDYMGIIQEEGRPEPEI